MSSTYSEVVKKSLDKQKSIIYCLGCKVVMIPLDNFCKFKCKLCENIATLDAFGKVKHSSYTYYSCDGPHGGCGATVLVKINSDDTWPEYVYCGGGNKCNNE
jgi:hypothetical protein